VLEESLAIFRVAGNPGMVAWTAHWVALAAFLAKDYAVAAHLGEETLRIETALGNTFGVTTVTWVLGLAQLEQGDLQRAALLLRDGLLKLREDFTDGPQHIGGLGVLAARRGQPARAARLLGAFDAARERGDQLSLPPPLLAHFRQHEGAVRAQLGEPHWTAAWEDGRAMAPRQAVDYALEELPSTRSPTDRSSSPAGNR
jgi:hypothetical protein